MHTLTTFSVVQSAFCESLQSMKRGSVASGNDDCGSRDVAVQHMHSQYLNIRSSHFRFSFFYNMHHFRFSFFRAFAAQNFYSGGFARSPPCSTNSSSLRLFSPDPAFKPRTEIG